MENQKRVARLLIAKDDSQTFNPVIQSTPDLPVVKWAAVGKSAPQLITTAVGELPKADVVIITWADAEWAAMEHVFCNGSSSMSYSARLDGSWSGWVKYDLDMPSPSRSDWTYWGYFRLVKIGAATVLLFKSNTHLSENGATVLSQMVSRIIDKAGPSLIISIGTAGGARVGDHIGTVNVVRAGSLYESKQPQSQWPNYSNNWSANWAIAGQAAFQQLLLPVPTVQADLEAICKQFNSFYGTNYPLSQLNPNNLNLADPKPSINNLTSTPTPLLTASSFVVGTTSGNLSAYACVEMDDAVIGQTCADRKVSFGFVRNISDPAQNASLPPSFQGHWGEAIYRAYGFYTSYNGAIVAWSLLQSQF